MHKRFLIAASLLGALAVALGAFAAHSLREQLPPEAVAVFDTGVRYQFYHVFALIAVALLMERAPGKLFRWAGNCFIAGIILFSGSLYVLTLLKIMNTSAKFVGILTPIGGLFFIVGWMLLLGAVNRTQHPQSL